MRGAARLDRRMLFWMARRLYRRRTAGISDPSNPERMLLVRVDERVGNLITLQSLIDAVRQRWPGLELGLLASARCVQVAGSLMGLDRLHELDKRWLFRSPGRWREIIGLVRRKGYQVAVDAGAWHEFSFTHAALTYYSGAPLRIGYRRGVDAGFHTHLVLPGPEGEYELRQRMRLLSVLGVVAEPPALRTGLGQGSAGRFAGWLRSLKVQSPRVGLWAGSRKLQRRWPVPFYIQLGHKLQRSHGAELVVLWGPGEEAIRDRIAGAVPEGIVVAPPTTIEELAGLIRNLDLVVTNDTGPMHLSVACRAPTVAMFASGAPGRWGHPYDFVRNLACPGRDPAEVDRAFEACSQLFELTGRFAAR